MLEIDRQYQNYRCWACDAKGDVFDFVMKFEKVEFGECLRMLGCVGRDRAKKLAEMFRKNFEKFGTVADRVSSGTVP